ncbi:NADP-dependent fatty aldehyde dehydrogenase [Tritonibacter multivorans]|uniref:NADP-dependent fatty aldehyde dehydrogenase n=1 Tax=Tritonibacter multivorans TaxID=928856 RepID=A0A0P1G8U9_9RHOB|nr:aldehyde dehydrogenase (NADP(+)) [Tritonibacter multivorans]MDA7422239.1 aldehyde dehydrogenase (NADP(+)) [Tritonibacter multivorans]CUH77843.1 NADP-dependent fatty aldehyde dehydrogenase [Tritonibacter multivorans]SFD10986.1 NADP-dependent aldehyde dehydrogenase [Tritonibacter multivorans]
MLLGKNLINGAWVGSDRMSPSADLDGFEFAQATGEQVDIACAAARAAFRTYANTSRGDRAAFLRAIAEEIDVLGDEITQTAMKETGLPEARLVGERGRTTGQLRMFADLIEDTQYLDIRKDEALPDRSPLPRPDLRLTHKAIGPVVVFGASNFPLAFSTAGGDTASALAAGCPVIVKGHGAHAGTAELVGQAVAKAMTRCAMPAGTFQMLQGSGREVGAALVQHPEIRAVGFTGSLAGGRALYDQCHSRPHPIPFYGELGSVNPMFCLPAAVAARGDALGTGWAGSLTMGAGQFCTNPGVAVVVKGDGADALEAACVAALKDVAEQTMLTDGIHEAYVKGVQTFRELMVEVGSCGAAAGKRAALPALFKVSAKEWMANPHLQEEVFGAAGILVLCDDIAEMQALAEGLEGQLTTTLHLDDADMDLAAALLPVLEEKAGRILANGFPTGVEVCSSMMHGGPYPASTDVRATSVGTLAIVRWLRPVSFQNIPSALLPEDLRG